MQQDNQKTNGSFFVILGLVMAVVSVLIVYMIFGLDILPGACFFLLFITIPLVLNGIAYLICMVVARIKGPVRIPVLPLTCLIMAIISAVIGGITYANDHSFILRGLEAELIWFFISIPAFVLAIIHFILSYVRLGRRVNDPDR